VIYKSFDLNRPKHCRWGRYGVRCVHVGREAALLPNYYGQTCYI